MKTTGRTYRGGEVLAIAALSAAATAAIGFGIKSANEGRVRHRGNPKSDLLPGSRTADGPLVRFNIGTIHDRTDADSRFAGHLSERMADYVRRS